MNGSIEIPRMPKAARWHVLAAICLLMFSGVCILAGFGGAAAVLYRISATYRVTGAVDDRALDLLLSMNLGGTAGVMGCIAAVAAWRKRWRASLATAGAAIVLAGLAVALHPGAIPI